MHRKRNQKLALLGLGLGLMLLAFTRCSTSDPCKDWLCVNGFCVDGACTCEAIYEGRHCDTLSSIKFLSEYWTSDVLCHGPGYSLSTQVRLGPQEGSLIVYNALQQGDSLQAIAHQDTIIAPQQVYGTGYVHGIGLYSPTAFTLEVVWEDATGLQTNCVAVYRR